MGNFLAELKRRNVFKVATIYIVVSWLVLQVVSIVFPVFEIPLWASRLVVVLLALGFPLAVILAWAFDLTPEGIEWQSSKGEHHVHTHAWDWILGVLLVVAIGLIVTSEIKHWRDTGVQVTADAPNPEPADDQDFEITESSIAVLPFANMSGDPDNEYFSDGMAEEILNLLAKIPTLKVIGRTSSFAFKGKMEDLRVIGQTLGVKALLQGSVRQSGDRVRITAQLIDVLDGSNIWAESYNRTMTDIFEVQDNVAAAIIDALQIHIGIAPSRGRPTEETDAYALFLRARALINSFHEIEAEKLALEAIAIDPEFVDAYELLASIYWTQAGSARESAEAQALMGETAAKALALDPNLVLAKALYESGNIGTYSARVEIEALETAARQQPDHPWTLSSLVFNLVKAGYLEEAYIIARRLASLDPLSPNAIGRLQVTLVATGRLGESFAVFDRLAELNFNQNSWYVGQVNLINKRDTVAIEHFEADLRENGFADTSWVRELIAGAGNPESGKAYLDRRIPEIVAASPEGFGPTMERRLVFWYLFFGHLDGYYDRIMELDLNDATWSDADDLVSVGTINRHLGFTAHPRYLEVAEILGYIDVWEHRGPPDFCSKASNDWVCE